MAAWSGWAGDVLDALAFDKSAPNLKFLNDWQKFEGSRCRDNPLNTKQSYTGAVNCLPNGVKAYPSTKAGTAATKITLQNGNYPDILAALKSGDPYTYAQPQKVAEQITKWGTPRYAEEYILAAGAPAGVPGATITPTGDVVSLEQAWHNLIHMIGVRSPARAKQGMSAISATRHFMRSGH